MFSIFRSRLLRTDARNGLRRCFCSSVVSVALTRAGVLELRQCGPRCGKGFSDLAFHGQFRPDRRKRAWDERADFPAVSFRDPLTSGLTGHRCETFLFLLLTLRSERFPENLSKKRPFVIVVAPDAMILWQKRPGHYRGVVATCKMCLRPGGEDVVLSHGVEMDAGCGCGGCACR